MALESLSEKLQSALKKFTSKGKLSQSDIKDGMREVRLAMLEADVNYKVVKDFIKDVTERLEGEKLSESLSPGQLVIKIVNEELTSLMGQKNQRLTFSPQSPTIYMLCGLQGAGKTTMAAKLAGYLMKDGKRPMLAACDIYRPAAIDQLKVVGEKVAVPVFEKGTQDPVKTAQEAIEYARHYNRDVLIIDTAGRLHIDHELMEELKRISAAVNPQEILLVVDSMTGQDAVNVAKEFNDTLEIGGVILTKLDGDTRGGAALSVKAVTKKPIKFSGTGEKLSDIEPFHPERMASRILGMGDMMSLIERAESAYEGSDAEDFAKKLNSKKGMNLEDFLEQMQQMKKMGSLKDIMGMIPGIGNKLKDVDIDDDSMKKPEAIIRSMTIAERRNPNLLNASRRKRIAAGSGTQVQDVNALIRRFEDAQKMMKRMQGMGKRGRFPNIKF
ncbi:MAG: signal recognition particle protein [Eubacteriales bacterium]|nr:signal recognition particle protein [Eubacteriales bacterium]